MPSPTTPQIGQISDGSIITSVCWRSNIPLPRSTNEKHIAENFTVTDFTLTPEDMKEMDERAKNGKRRRYPKEALGFDDEFDYSYNQCWPKYDDQS